MRRLLLLLTLLLIACGTPAPTVPAAATPAPLPTPQTVPPTFTPVTGERPSLPTRTPAPTQSQTPTDETPIPFDQTVLELRYQIPALNLDRRLQANAASQILLVDETTQQGQQRDNQGRVLLSVQEALTGITLAPLPDDCDRCVRVSYALPLAEEAAAGWLQDPVLLASIENFFTAALGPHFPPQTAVGLHRTASPYAPAQTLAITDDGTLWVWQANQGTVPAAETADPAILDALAQLPADLAASYTVSCPGVSGELLWLRGENGPQQIDIACPEYALPATLLPLYAPLDALMAARLTDNLPRPPAAFPLTALLDYRRADAARLTLYRDGTAVAMDAAGAVFTDTLAIPQTISVTTGLIAADVVQPGLNTFRQDETGSLPATRLIVRGPDGVYDGGWADGETLPNLQLLDQLLVTLLPPTPAVDP